MHVTDADVTFYDGLGLLTVQTAWQVYNSMLVKTWICAICFNSVRYCLYRFLCNEFLFNHLNTDKQFLCLNNVKEC